MTENGLEEAVAELAARVWGDVGKATIAPLAGDASSRRYFRVSWRSAPIATAVLMVQSGSGLSISSDELSTVGDVAEMPFLNVQRYLAANGIAVPQVFIADRARGYVLLEDIGDVTLWDAVGAGDAGALFRQAIDELVLLQKAGAARPDPACIAFQQRFDARLFAWEFEHFLEHGLAGRSVREDDVSALRRRFAELAESLASGPLVLTHRDYHSWNLFVHQGRIRVIDFQDALLAPLPYDLATLLNDRATPTRIAPALERELVAYFAKQHAAALGTDIPADFLERYYLFVLQKSLKIVGRFHYLETVKRKSGYVAMLPHTFATLRRCFENLPALDDVRSTLARSFAELA